MAIVYNYNSTPRLAQNYERVSDTSHMKGGQELNISIKFVKLISMKHLAFNIPNNARLETLLYAALKWHLCEQLCSQGAGSVSNQINRHHRALMSDLTNLL